MNKVDSFDAIQQKGILEQLKLSDPKKLEKIQQKNKDSKNKTAKNTGSSAVSKRKKQCKSDEKAPKNLPIPKKRGRGTGENKKGAKSKKPKLGIEIEKSLKKNASKGG